MYMRDDTRIDRICDLLKEKWKRVPEQRLGQFLINYVFGSIPPHDGYIFHREDVDVEEILKNFEVGNIG